MDTTRLPSAAVMRAAFLGRDPAYDGVFVTAVTTTGIFCRPTCPAKKPRLEHVRFYATPREALLSGYRPCRRCFPMEAAGSPPEWLRPLLAAVEAQPARRWTDADLKERGVSPERARRWFQQHHGMTFHAYSRARRLGSALGQMQEGSPVTGAAFASGYESLSGFHEAFRRYFGDCPTGLAGRTVVTVDRLATPLGPMVAGATETGLCLLEFVDRRMLATQVRRLRSRLPAVFVPGRTDVTAAAAMQLAQYFAGARRAFDLPLQPVGTDFQQRVWRGLGQIPFGATTTYQALAAAVGRPAAVRAVGAANGHNALAIVVPCHRVVGADGQLVGYGGGLWRKRRLLELEGGVEAGADERAGAEPATTAGARS